MSWVFSPDGKCDKKLREAVLEVLSYPHRHCLKGGFVIFRSECLILTTGRILKHFIAGGFWASVQFSRSVVSNSLRPHEPQNASPPCPSPTPGFYPNSCPLSQWCHLTISSSVIPFSSCPQSFLTSGSLQMSQLFTSGGQSIGALASPSVLLMNTQDWSPLGWTGWISLQSKGLSRIFSNTTVLSICVINK